MAIKSTIPQVKPQVQPQQDKYPVMVLEGEYNGKPTLRVTNNEKNFKYDTFNGGASKLKNLFACDKDGDVVIATLAKWLVSKGVLTQDQLVTWFERLSQQLSDVVTGDSGFIPV